MFITINQKQTNYLISIRVTEFMKNQKFLIYENIELHFKRDDPQYIIKSISGVLYF